MPHKKPQKLYQDASISATTPYCCSEEKCTFCSLSIRFDLGSLSFCDDHSDVKHLAESIFELGEMAPANECIDPKSYLSGWTAVASALGEVSD